MQAKKLFMYGAFASLLIHGLLSYSSQKDDKSGWDQKGARDIKEGMDSGIISNVVRKAIEDGDAKTLFGYLDKHPEDLYAVDTEGNNLLMMALSQEKRNMPIVMGLIERIRNLNFRNALEETAIFRAIRSLPDNKREREKEVKEQINLLSMLAKNGADMNITDTHGHTPLSQAIFFNNEPAVRFLLDHKADLQAPIEDGFDVLRYAIHVRKYVHTDIEEPGVSIIKLLLDRGANIEGNLAYWKPLDMAIYFGYFPVVQLLISRGANIKSVPSPIELARDGLKRATTKKQKQNYDKIIELLEKQDPKYKIEASRGIGASKMSGLSEGGKSAEMASILEEFTAGPTAPSKITINLIKKALRGEDPAEFAKIVRENNTSLKLKDEAGDTPLLLAIKYGNAQAIEAILELAAAQPKLLKAVLSHKNAQGFNAYGLAQALENKAAIELLKKFKGE